MEDSKGKKKVSVRTEQHGDDIYHKVSGLPKLQELNAEVKKLVDSSSYWERYGLGLLDVGSAVPGHLLGLYLCSSDSPATYLAGFLILGCCHSVLTSRAGHLAAHNALCETKGLNAFIRWLTVEFMGFFSDRAAYEIHIGDHHPYTNIIGLGDSSSWKAPLLPRYIYMLIAPMSIPILAPLVSLQKLYGRPLALLSFCFWASLGFTFNIFLIMAITGYTTVLSAALFMFAFRAVHTISYIHINIFQHIGLPMYVLKDRPSKLYQMSTGVLNLNRNMALDWMMGHTLVSCHVEHHLFPTLSDNMALKVRPLVKRFMLENGLAYHERQYAERFWHFLEKYEELMVKAPPFTHYVGLQ